MTKLLCYLCLVFHVVCTVIGANVRADALNTRIAAPVFLNEVPHDAHDLRQNSSIPAQNTTYEDRWSKVANQRNDPFSHNGDPKQSPLENCSSVEQHLYGRSRPIKVSDRQHGGGIGIQSIKKRSPTGKARYEVTPSNVRRAIVHMWRARDVYDELQKSLQKKTRITQEGIFVGRNYAEYEGQTHEIRLSTDPDSFRTHQSSAQSVKTLYLRLRQSLRSSHRDQEASQIEAAFGSFWPALKKCFDALQLASRRFHTPKSDAAGEARRQRMSFMEEAGYEGKSSDDGGSVISKRSTLLQQHVFQHRPTRHGLVRRTNKATKAMEDSITVFKELMPEIERRYACLVKENNVKVTARGVKLVVPDSIDHQHWIDRVIASPLHRVLYEYHQVWSNTKQDHSLQCSDLLRRPDQRLMAARLKRAINAWWSICMRRHEQYIILCRRYDIAVSDEEAERRRKRIASSPAGQGKQGSGKGQQAKENRESQTSDSKTAKGLKGGFLDGKISKGVTKGFFDRGKDSASVRSGVSIQDDTTRSQPNDNRDDKGINKRSASNLTSRSLSKRVISSAEVDEVIRNIYSIKEAMDQSHTILTDPNQVRITAQGVRIQSTNWEHGKDLQNIMTRWTEDDRHMRADQMRKIISRDQVRGRVARLRAEGLLGHAQRLEHTLDACVAAEDRFLKEAQAICRRYHIARSDAQEMERRERLARARSRLRAGRKPS